MHVEFRVLDVISIAIRLTPKLNGHNKFVINNIPPAATTSVSLIVFRIADVNNNILQCDDKIKVACRPYIQSVVTSPSLCPIDIET